MTRMIKTIAMLGILAGIFGLGGAREAKAAGRPIGMPHPRYWHNHRRHYRYYSPHRVYVYRPQVVYTQPSVVYTQPTYYSYSDSQVSSSVLYMLATRFPGQIEDLKLRVRNGRVRIDGEVRSGYIRHAISREIGRIPGVRSVDNDLDVDD